jgi:hypothetical protein
MATSLTGQTLTKEEQQIATKLGQKLTESMSRMHKNAMQFCFVNQESASYPVTRVVADKSFTIKRGPNVYSCTDRIIGMVSYFEDPEDPMRSYITLCLNVPGALLHESAGGIGYKSCVNLRTLHFQNDSDPDNTKYNLYGLGFHLMGTQTFASVSVGQDDQLRGQWHFSMKALHPSPFKEADEVMKRFYDLMRARGFLKDESEDEDMGSLADSAGIEW